MASNLGSSMIKFDKSPSGGLTDGSLRSLHASSDHMARILSEYKETENTFLKQCNNFEEMLLQLGKKFKDNPELTSYFNEVREVYSEIAKQSRIAASLVDDSEIKKIKKS
ncbi:MAG: hypothetical protein RLZ35_364 [Pseudomonadota bacterium]|jgi:superfamily I DNA/RNA helicase